MQIYITFVSIKKKFAKSLCLKAIFVFKFIKFVRNNRVLFVITGKNYYKNDLNQPI